MEGYDRPWYTNVQYPFPVNPPHIPNLNPSMMYRRKFYMSDRDLNNVQYLRFEGVDSAISCMDKMEIMQVTVKEAVSRLNLKLMSL